MEDSLDAFDFVGVAAALPIDATMLLVPFFQLAIPRVFILK